MQNQVVLNLSSESKFNNQLTSRFLFDPEQGGIGIINFSEAMEIINYDYYGLKGGTQVIEVEMTLIEKTTKIPSNVIYPVKAPITYSNKIKKTQLELNYNIGDWYGSDFFDIYDPNNFKKNSQPSLKAFFILQHDFGHRPFKAEIKFKKNVTVVPNI